MKFLRHNAIALTALVFAMTGTGIAASRYLITSTTQIKPSVLRELRTGAAEAAEVKLAKSGAHGIVDRVALTEPFTITPDAQLHEVPVTGATWTQKAGEVQGVAGGLLRIRSRCSTNSDPMEVQIWLDGESVGRVELNPDSGETSNRVVRWNSQYGDGPLDWLGEAATNVTHTVKIEASEGCEGGGEGAVIEGLRLSVVGLK